MRKLFTATAVCALAGGLAVAPSVGAKPGAKAPKDVASTVTVAASPSTVEASTTTLAVSGNVKAESSCRKNRTVRFSFTDASGTTALVETAVTASNGDYRVTLPKPSTSAPATVTLTATVDEATRVTNGESQKKGKGKGKKKGHTAGKGKKKGHGKGKATKFNCLQGSVQASLTVTS